MTDLEIYIDGFNDKGIQIANAFPDVMRYKLNELGADSTDAFTKIFDTSDIETEQYYINILLEDLKLIGGQPCFKKQDNFSENMDLFTLAWYNDVEVKTYFDLNDIELLRTACSHNSQKHS